MAWLHRLKNDRTCASQLGFLGIFQLGFFSSSSCASLAHSPCLCKDSTGSVSFYECTPSKEHLFFWLFYLKGLSSFFWTFVPHSQSHSHSLFSSPWSCGSSSSEFVPLRMVSPGITAETARPVVITSFPERYMVPKIRVTNNISVNAVLKLTCTHVIKYLNNESTPVQKKTFIVQACLCLCLVKDATKHWENKNKYFFCRKLQTGG